MNTFRKILVVSILMLTSFAITSAKAENIPQNLIVALKKGDSNMFAKYLGDRVELSILNKESIYSKLQATQIISKFFKESRPTDFKKKHSSGKSDTSYVIGDLITQRGTFRVNFLLKKRGSDFKIHQLHIERK